MSYANQPETIQELKHEIKVAKVDFELSMKYASIQWKILKNLVDRIGYCAASRGSHLNEIVFHV